MRVNANPSLITDEQIFAYRDVYQDYLVRWHRDHFYDKGAKVEVCLMDAVASKLTYYLAERFFASLPEFYENHRVGAMRLEECDAHRELLQQLEILPIFRDVCKNLLRDGHTLWEPLIKEDGGFDSNIYGDWECPPTYWMRYGEAFPEPNRIRYYIVNYVPRTCQGYQHNLHGIRKQYGENQIYHFTLGSWNEGYGWSFLLRAWDSVTKLRYASNADQFLRDVRYLILVPESWKKNRIDRFADTVDNWSHRRALIIKAQQDANMAQTGLPSFGYVSMMMPGQSKQGSGNMFQKSTTGETLQDPEYGRLFIATGFGKTWFVKAEAGTLAGSEVNFTDDLLAEIQVFRLIEPIIKKMIMIVLQPLIDAGRCPPLPETYALKFWKESEILEKQAAAAQAQLDMIDYQNESKDKAQKENANNYNRWVERRVLLAVRTNSSMPMTPVMSSWIRQIGYDETTQSLLMQTHQGYEYERPVEDGEEAYLEWIAAGSKGGHFWDYYADRDPAWKRTTIEIGEFGQFAGTPEQMREFKMKGEKKTGTPALGTSREPFYLPGGEEKGTITEYTKLPGSIYGTTEGSTTPKGQPPIPAELWTPGYVHAPESITESKKTGPGRKRKPGRSKTRKPIIAPGTTEIFPISQMGYYKNEAPPQMSRKRFNEFTKIAINHTFGNETIDRIKKLWDFWDKQAQYKNVMRVNSSASGNGLAFTPLYYEENGAILEEYPCLIDYKKNNLGKTVPLEVGHNQGQYIVGSYTLEGWDDEKDNPIAKIEYDEDLVVAALKRLNKEDSRIMKKLKAGLVPDVSEEYTTTVIPEWFSKKLNRKIRLQRDIELVRVAFVDYGNCRDDICIMTKLNSKTISEYIKCCMDKHGPKGDGTMTHEQCIAAAYKELGGHRK